MLVDEIKCVGMMLFSLEAGYILRSLANIKLKTLLLSSYCMVCVTGVAQVLNRLDGQPFNDADQRLFEVYTCFYIFSTYSSSWYIRNCCS